MASYLTLADIEGDLVRKRALATASVHMRDFGAIRPMAFILSTYDPILKREKSAPEPVVVGGDGASTADLKVPIRAVSMKTHAVGVVFVHEEDGMLKVNLEHKELGDLEWQAKASRRVIGELGDAAPPKVVTRYLPRRYLQ